MNIIDNVFQSKLVVKRLMFAAMLTATLGSSLAVNVHAASGSNTSAAQQARNLEMQIRRGSSLPSAGKNHDVSCHPSDYAPGVCPDALAAGCKKYGGTMTSNSDGSYTCKGPYTGPK
ncbi:MAG: hypothetical protein ABJN40_04850 [Sneathiella sp.]